LAAPSSTPGGTEPWVTPGQASFVSTYTERFKKWANQEAVEESPKRLLKK